MKKTEEISVYVTLLAAGLAFGTVPVFSALLRELQVSSIEQSFIRLFIGALAGVSICFYFLRINNKNFSSSLEPSIQKTYVLQGIFLSLSLNCFLASIAVGTPIGEASILCQIHPIIALFLAWQLLNEPITRSKITAIILALVGIVFLTESWAWTSFLSTILGDILSLMSGAAYAIYLILGRKSVNKRKNITNSLSTAWVLIWGFVMWLPIILVIQLINLPPEIATFSLTTFIDFEKILFGIGLGTIGNVVPFGLIMLTANKIESSKASILLIVEPIGAILLGFFIMGEPITIWYVIGGFFLLLAVLRTIIIPKSENYLETRKSLSFTRS